jgi:hypothetical protein
LEPNRGGISDRKICLAVSIGVTLGVLVSLLQLGGDSKQWLNQLQTTADAADVEREGQVYCGSWAPPAPLLVIQKSTAEAEYSTFVHFKHPDVQGSVPPAVVLSWELF